MRAPLPSLAPYTFITVHILVFALARAHTLPHSLIYEKTLKIMARFRVILIFALCCFSLASHSFCAEDIFIIVAPRERSLTHLLHFIMDFSLSLSAAAVANNSSGSASNSVVAWIFSYSLSFYQCFLYSSHEMAANSN